MTWLLAIPSRIKGALAALGLIAVALLTAKRHGAREAERDMKRRASEARAKHTQDAEEIENEVANMGKPERRSRLGDMFQSHD